MVDLVESRGWPFADCSIHVQFRGDDNHFNIDEIRQACKDFGRVLKIYTWKAKRSQKLQACVMFDSAAAVKLAEKSLHGNTCRLWRTGYHMLRMCESTTTLLENRLVEEGYTRDHPMFAGISTKRTSASYQVHAPVRGIKPVEKRPIPTGPRYQPYSLDARPHAPYAHSPQINQSDSPYISFPPKRDTMSPRGQSPNRSQPVKQRSFGSPTQPNFGTSKLEKSAAPSSPANPAIAAQNSGNAGSSHAAHIDTLEQTQINRKLQTDIQELVSAQIDSVAKVQEVEAENERLRTRLRNTEDELALLEDTVKRVEGREQAAIALLSDVEAVHNATKKAYARDQEEMLLLKDSYEAVKSAKIKAETELEALKEKFETSEAQLLRAQEQLRLSSFPERSIEPSARSKSSRPETGEASSVEQDKTCVTTQSTVEFVRHLGVEKANLQQMGALLDAFKEIDDLVRAAFRAA